MWNAESESLICVYPHRNHCFWAAMELALVAVLRAVWIAAILPILVALIPSSKLCFFHDLLLGFAKRGKIMRSPSNKFTVPQKFFCHFYILASLWSTLLLVAMWVYACHSTKENRSGVLQSVFLLLLMETQALRRLYESIYVFKYSSSARMHIFGYFVGFFFYAAAPLSLCCNYVPEAFKFGLSLFQELIVSGKHGMRVTEFDLRGCINPLRHLKWYSWVGAAIFFWGWVHQHCCHVILGMLRKNKEQNDKYSIPHGDWFEYVSCPHYLAEIVIYSGLVLASGCLDLTLWLVFGFVVVNLVFAASETHRWYQHKFENYPKKRFAVLPFVC